MNVAWGPAEWLGVGGGGAAILVGMALALAAGTVVRALTVRRRDDEESRERWRSVKTWWMLYLGLIATLLLGRGAVVLVMAGLSLLALREGLELAEAPSIFPWLVAPTLALYVWGWLDWSPLFTRVLPLAIVLHVVLELGGQIRSGPRRLTHGRAVARAVLVAVVGPSFVVAVASLPPHNVVFAYPLGSLLLLVLLTEINDIAQAWWGRALGAHRLAPLLSPAKTWEGFWGGLLTTVILALLLAPALTNWGRIPPPGLAWAPPWVGALLLAVVLAGAGIIGDLLVSGLKRRAGADHSGSLLPGQGGILDRLDSLAATAPSFFFLTLALWMGPA